MTDTQIYYGGAIKDLGNGKVGGYLVVFGDETKTDLEGEFFTPDTDFDLEDTAATSIYYQHGLDPVVKKRSLGKGTIAKRDEVGLWVEAQLKLRDEYEQAIYGMVQAGKMGWSSGTAAHLVERVPAGKSFHITRWPLGLDASITPTPAEPRTQALSLKSIPVFELKRVVDDTAQGQVIPDTAPETTPEDAQSVGDVVTSDNALSNVTIEVKERNTMSEEQTQNNTPLSNPDVDQAIEAKFSKWEEKFDARLKEIMGHIENSPRLMKSGFFTQDGGDADPQVKSFGDFMLSVYRKDTKRLKSVYKAQTESSATGGGYLVPEEFHNEIVQLAAQSSPILSRVRRIPVAAPSGMMPALDQFLTPTAGGGHSALYAGAETNIRAEGGSYTEESLTFTSLEYRCYDALSGSFVTTRELTEDAPAMQSLLIAMFSGAQQSKAEQLILFGSGVGQPLGVLSANNAAAVGVDAATNDAFVIGDVMGIMSHYKGQGQPLWVAHPSVLPDLGALSNGSGAVSYTPTLQGAMPMTLFGYPVVFSEHMAQTNNPKDIALIDFSLYYWFERGTAYVDFSEHANFTTGKDTWRFGQRVDGKPALKNRITLADSTGGFYVSPYVYNND